MLRFGRCLAAVVAASALLGAGPPDPREAAGLLAYVSDLASAAHPSATASGDDVRSFRIKFSGGSGERFTVILDHVRRAAKFIDVDDGRTSMYIVARTSYMRARDGTWSKLDFSHFPAATTKPHASRTPESRIGPEKSARFHVLPDRRIDGVLMGVVAETIPTGQFDHRTHSSKPLTITCAYEKETGRMRTCDASPLFTATFDRYNDPANQVVVPPEALNAPDLALPSK